MKYSLFFSGLLLLFFVSCSRSGEGDVSGKVVKIADGDTFTLLTPRKEEVKVRLAEIDAPERGQPYGKASRQALSELVFGKEVRVEMVDTDRYGRLVGRVFQGETDVNAEMVRLGAAWVYTKYNKDKSLIRVEKRARANRDGLWALPPEQVIAPWEYRKKK